MFNLVLGFLLTLISQTIYAHEGRPVYIEVNEQAVGIEVKWKIPPVFSPNTEPRVSLSNENCELDSSSGQKLIGSKHYTCSSYPAKPKITISYPSDNPSLSSLVFYQALDGRNEHIYSSPEILEISIGDERSFGDIAVQYIKGGIEHILLGWDHLCFVFCLILLAANFRRLLITITGFTLAHTITLIAATLDLIVVPIQFIEILIALSIILLAAELVRENNVEDPTLTRKYPFIAASVLGLLHGFGFASVLSDLGLPEDTKISALLFFNLGVEIGQLLFIGFASIILLLLSNISSLKAYKGQSTKGLIYLIGITAGYWMIQRSLTSL